MGYSTDFFVEEVDQNLKCAICWEVFQAPQSLPCGHTFCRACLEEGKVQQCPACRRGTTTSTSSTSPTAWVPCFLLQGVIGNLQITCRNNNTAEPPTKQRRRVPLHTPVYSVTTKRPWVGKLSEWQKHATTECCLPIGSCDVKGFGFVGNVQELEKHKLTAVNKHVQTLGQRKGRQKGPR